MRPPLLRLHADELIVDNFAGGGGASLGIEWALGRSPDIAINHDPEAISMHKANHPTTQHFCEDVWEVDPVKACAGRPVGLAWFSPDCKHFSKAKGGKPVDKQIRGLAWIVVKWAKAVRPRVIILENVEEFATWGPLLEDGKPCPMRKGLTFRRWLGNLRALGYEIDWQEFRACDYGAPTIRKRLFLVARRDGGDIVWPEPSHGRYLQPYRTAAECIDWSIPCPSIFERAKPLADNTLRRIAEGIRKFVIESGDPFIVPIAHYNGSNPVHCINEPLRTITATTKGGEFAVIAPMIVGAGGPAYSGKPVSANLPIGTLTAENHRALIGATLIQTGYGEREGQAPRVPGLGKPLGTVVAGGSKHALVSAFLSKHYGGVVGTELPKPIGTVTAVDHHSLTTAHLMKLYGTCKDGQDMRAPMPTVTSTGQHIAEVCAFLIKFYSTGGQWQSLSDPMHTVPATDRLGLVTVRGEQYVIADIGMRMLAPRELYRAQGFAENYLIDLDYKGKPLTKTAQVRMCGNSVSPPMAQAIAAAQFSAHQLTEVA